MMCAQEKTNYFKYVPRETLSFSEFEYQAMVMIAKELNVPLKMLYPPVDYERIDPDKEKQAWRILADKGFISEEELNKTLDAMAPSALDIDLKENPKGIKAGDQIEVKVFGPDATLEFMVDRVGWHYFGAPDDVGVLCAFVNGGNEAVPLSSPTVKKVSRETLAVNVSNPQNLISSKFNNNWYGPKDGGL